MSTAAASGAAGNSIAVFVEAWARRRCEGSGAQGRRATPAALLAKAPTEEQLQALRAAAFG